MSTTSSAQDASEHKATPKEPQDASGFARGLLRAAVLLSPFGMLMGMVGGFLTPRYSSIRQHMSELERLGGAVAMATRAGAVISGAGIVAFGVALILQKPVRMPFTAGLASIFGVSMISNGVFVMGSPLHGLYALGLSGILVPATFVAELPRVPSSA